MGKILTLPENFKMVQLAQPQTTNGGVTSDYVSLKNVLMAWILVELTQAVGHATLISPRQASAVAGTGVKVLSNNASGIWANEDIATTDTLVKKTDAKNYTVTNDIKNKTIVFGIDPASLDLANGFDVINLLVADSSQVTNLISVTALLDMRYKQATPPAAITD